MMTLLAFWVCRKMELTEDEFGLGLVILVGFIADILGMSATFSFAIEVVPNWVGC